MTSIRRLLFTLTSLVLMFSAAGCGSAGSSGSGNSTSNNGGSGTTPPSSSTSQAVQGQWTFTGTGDGIEAVVSANITNSGNSTFSAAPGSVVICPIYDPGQSPTQIAEEEAATCNISEASLNGTITPPNTVSITISNIALNYQDVGIATLTGTYTSSSSTITAMQGTLSTSSQDSPMTSGNWTGQPNTSFTGNYSGTVNYLNGSVPINVTLNVTQNANYKVTGTITVSGDPCYAGWTFSGSAIGGGFGAVSDSGSVAVGAIQTSSSGILFGYKSLNGCSTAGIGVLGTSSQTQAVKVTEAQKAMLNKVLNALQAKVKDRIADKQRELLRKELNLFP